MQEQGQKAKELSEEQTFEQLKVVSLRSRMSTPERLPFLYIQCSSTLYATSNCKTRVSMHREATGHIHCTNTEYARNMCPCRKWRVQIESFLRDLASIVNAVFAGIASQARTPAETSEGTPAPGDVQATSARSRRSALRTTTFAAKPAKSATINGWVGKDAALKKQFALCAVLHNLCFENTECKLS